MLNVLAELDELVLSVRDRNSRAYIDEAVRAYRQQLTRAAIVSTWTALVYDLIGKVRELSAHGDVAAQTFVQALDDAIATNNRVKLQQIENGILDTAQNDYEFINARERIDLERLQQDRHLCAHPAFTGEANLFVPSSELVRVHVVHAIEHVLRNPPVQGRAALVQLREDILRPSFPTDQESVNVFLGDRYLSRARSALVEQMIGAVLSVLLRGSDRDLFGKPDALGMTLVSIGLTYPNALESRLRDLLPRRVQGMEDDYLINVLLLCHYESRCWEWIDGPTRIRIQTWLRDTHFEFEDWGVVGYAFSINGLSKLARDKFEGLDEDDQETIVYAHLQPHFVDDAISIYRKSVGWRTAERLGQQLMIPLAPVMSAEQVSAMLAAAQSNSQVWDAGGMKEVMAQLFDLTGHCRIDTDEAWQNFATFVTGQGKSYGDLKTKMTYAGIWPLPDFDDDDD